MTQQTIRPLGERKRANWIRLRTMILLRWVAIAGQFIAVTVTPFVFGLQLEMGWCYFVIGISVIGNMVAAFVFPENKRLTERQNVSMIIFDLLQLSCLLFLTGGLNNPFTLLLLGPVTISATALSMRSTMVLCAVAIISVTVLAFFYLPLRTQEGDILNIPKELQTVKVSGEVLAPITVVFRAGSGLKQYVSQAGGTTNKALLKRSFVIYANGAVKGTRKPLFLNWYPKITPGAEIFVPQRSEKNKLSSQELLGLTSGIASLGAIILGIINLSK